MYVIQTHKQHSFALFHIKHKTTPSIIEIMIRRKCFNTLMSLLSLDSWHNHLLYILVLKHVYIACMHLYTIWAMSFWCLENLFYFKLKRALISIQNVNITRALLGSMVYKILLIVLFRNWSDSLIFIYCHTDTRQEISLDEYEVLSQVRSTSKNMLCIQRVIFPGYLYDNMIT